MNPIDLTFLKSRYSKALLSHILLEEYSIHKNISLLEDFVYAGESIFSDKFAEGAWDSLEPKILPNKYPNKEQQSLLIEILTEPGLEHLKKYIFEDKNYKSITSGEGLLRYILKSLTITNNKQYAKNIINHYLDNNLFKTKLYEFEVLNNNNSKTYLYQYLLDNKYDIDVLDFFYSKGHLPPIKNKLTGNNHYFYSYGDNYNLMFKNQISQYLKQGDFIGLTKFKSNYNENDFNDYLISKFKDKNEIYKMANNSDEYYDFLISVGAIDYNSLSAIQNTTTILTAFVNKNNKKATISFLDNIIGIYASKENSEIKKFLDSIFYTKHPDSIWMRAIFLTNNVDIFGKLLVLHKKIYPSSKLDHKFWHDIDGARRKIELAEYIVLSGNDGLIKKLSEHYPIDTKKLKHLIKRTESIKEGDSFNSFEKVILNNEISAPEEKQNSLKKNRI